MKGFERAHFQATSPTLGWVMFFIVLVGLILTTGVVIVAAQSAPPPLPASFYGTVNGELDSSTAILTAVIDDTAYATTALISQDNQLVYTIKIPSDDPTTTPIEGGQAGDTIFFQIDGRAVAETAVWQSGVNAQLDMTLTADALPAPAAQAATSTPFPWWIIAIVVILLLALSLWLWQRQKSATNG